MSSVFLTDVDDYINPSQGCINPLFSPQTRIDNNNNNDNDETKKKKKLISSNTSNKQVSNENENENEKEKSQSSLRRRKRRQRRPILKLNDEPDMNTVVREKDHHSTNATATTVRSKDVVRDVSVADCLACSGCVTTAEAVLVEAHSIPTLLALSQQTKNKQIVYTWSFSSLADMARVLDMTPFQILQLSASVLPGCIAVSDGSWSLSSSLEQSAMEFCHRYTNHTTSSQHLPQKNNTTTSSSYLSSSTHTTTTTTSSSTMDLATPSIALSKTKTRYLVKSNNNTTMTDGIEVKHDVGPDERILFDPKNQQYLIPMLSSSCPGLVCFVEKNMSSQTTTGTNNNDDDTLQQQHPALISHLSSVKSSMSCAGTILKHGQHKNKLYHVAIMPCHDKKLEAARLDFHDGTNQDVDLVVTTSEIFDYWKQTASSTNSNNHETTTTTTTTTISNVKQYLYQSTNQHNNSNIPMTLLCENNNKNWITKLQSLLLQNSTTTNATPIILTSLEQSQQPEKSLMDVSSSSQIKVNTSGGYAEYIFRRACSELFDTHIPNCQELPWKPIIPKKQSRRRNNNHASSSILHYSDFMSLTLYLDKSSNTYTMNEPPSSSHDDDTYEVVLKFGIAYGFKNVQLVLQQLRNLFNCSNNNSTNKKNSWNINEYHYIEVMACPHGCLNGGGQIRPQVIRMEDDKTLSSSDTTTTTTTVVNYLDHARKTSRRETPSDTKQRVLQSQMKMNQIFPTFIHEKSNNNDGTRFVVEPKELQTRYHIVPKLELSKGATVGLAVEDTKW